MNVNPFKKTPPTDPQTPAPQGEDLAQKAVDPNTEITASTKKVDREQTETPADYTDPRNIKLSAADRLNAMSRAGAEDPSSDTTSEATPIGQTPKPKEITPKKDVPDPNSSSPANSGQFDVNAIEATSKENPFPEGTTQTHENTPETSANEDTLGTPTKEAVARESVLRADFPTPDNVQTENTPSETPKTTVKNTLPSNTPEPELTILQQSESSVEETPEKAGGIPLSEKPIDTPAENTFPNETPLDTEPSIDQSLPSSKISDEKGPLTLTDDPIEYGDGGSTALYGTQEKEIPEQETPGKEGAEKEGDLGIRPIRTFKEDVNRAMRDQKSTLVSMVLAEQKKKLQTKEERSPKSKKNMVLIVGSLGLFVAGIMIVLFTISTFNQEEPDTPSFFHPGTFLIAADDHNEISLDDATRNELVSALTSKRIEQQRLDTIRNIYFTLSSTIETRNGPQTELRLTGPLLVFEHLEAQIPDALLRTIEDRFMLGIHSFDNNHPFIILKTNFYENAFSGMLTWEQTLPHEFTTWFGLPYNRSELQALSFRDEVIKNKDVRIMRTLEGTPVVLYSFIDRTTIIITNNENTLHEVIRRLNLPAPNIQ